MKKLIALLLMIGLFLLTPGCGPSEAEYQQLKDENERLKKELETISREYEICQDATYDYYEKERPMLEARIEALEAQRSTAASQASTPSPAPEPEPASVEPEDTQPAVRTTGGYYVVRRGDTVNGIAIKLNVSKTALMRTNNIRNEARIYAGQRLKVPSAGSSRTQPRTQTPSPRPAPEPPPRTATPAPEPAPRPTSPPVSGARITFYYVRPHDTLPRISAKTGVDVEILKRLNDIDENTPLRVGQRLFLR